MIDVWVLFADKFDTPHGTSPRREKHCFVDIGSGVFADDAVGKLLDRRVDEESEDRLVCQADVDVVDRD